MSTTYNEVMCSEIGKNSEHRLPNTSGNYFVCFIDRDVYKYFKNKGLCYFDNINKTWKDKKVTSWLEPVKSTVSHIIYPTEEFELESIKSLGWDITEGSAEVCDMIRLLARYKDKIKLINHNYVSFEELNREKLRDLIELHLGSNNIQVAVLRDKQKNGQIQPNEDDNRIFESLFQTNIDKLTDAITSLKY